jgi:hypothetical protein
MAMKNSNDTIGNRSRDLPVCSVVPQPTAPPRASGKIQPVKNSVRKCGVIFSVEVTVWSPGFKVVVCVTFGPTVQSLAEIPTIIVTTGEYYLNVDCIHLNAALLFRDVTFLQWRSVVPWSSETCGTRSLKSWTFFSDRSGLKLKALLYFYTSWFTRPRPRHL